MQDRVSGVSPPVSNSRISPAYHPEQQVHDQTQDDAVRRQVEQPSASSKQDPLAKRMTREELLEMLDRINLTFDLFEVQAKFYVDEEDDEVKVIIRNLRTGQLIRTIPPEEFAEYYHTFKAGVGLLYNGSF